MGMDMNSKQTVSREGYSNMGNRMTFILQLCWPTNYIYR